MRVDEQEQRRVQGVDILIILNDPPYGTERSCQRFHSGLSHPSAEGGDPIRVNAYVLCRQVSAV